MNKKLQTFSVKVLLILSFFFFQLTEVSAQWKTLRIGGGGAITSIQAHPKVQNLYFITTDVGTPYRWNATTEAWEGLFYSLPSNYWATPACGNLAFDPSDVTGNVLYATFGGQFETGGVFKSVDRGTTWLDCNLPLNVRPNSDQGYGQRIAVDPNNSDIIFVTTRPSTTGVTTINGTFKSVDAGKTWTKINDLCGAYILFDVSGGTTSGASNRIYLGCANGVYQSINGGTNFNLMSGSPANSQRAEIHSSGILYLTYFKSVGKWDGTTWSVITPSQSTAQVGPIAVNPNNSDQLIVGNASSNPYVFYQYVSNNAGVSWTKITPQADLSDVPWFDNWVGQGLKDFCWDPFDQNMVWFTDFFHPFQTTNIWAGSNVAWKARAVGEEETVCVGNVLCPPSGQNLLHSNVADLGGWDHKSITTPPSVGMMKFFPWTTSGQAGNMTGVAIQETDPNFIARVGRHGWSGTGFAGYSTDGGATYNYWTCPADAAGGRIAVSATSRTMVWVTQAGPCYRSTDLGATWTKIESLPTSVLINQDVFTCGPVHPVAADKVNGDKFYVYTGGKFYTSTDAGATFSQVATLPNPYIANAQSIETTPGKEGDIWVAANSGGLYHSTNSGANFKSIANVQKANFVSIGKASPSNPNVPAVYVFGSINNIPNSLFRSNDEGTTWELLSSPVHTGIDAFSMAADRQVYGRVFVATTGNGIMYKEEVVDNQAPTAPMALEAVELANSTIQIKWAPSVDNVAVNSYQINKNGVFLASTGNTSYSVSGLTPGETYTFTVQAKDLAGNLSPVSTVTITPSATSVPAINLSLNATASATASSMQASYSASNAIDGNLTTRWSQITYGPNEWLKIDLGAQCNIVGADIYWERPEWIYKYKIEVSNDDSNWVMALDKTTNAFYGLAPEAVNFTANNYRYIRITVTSWGNGGWWISINEFKVYGNVLTANKNINDSHVKIYPNPVSDNLHIVNVNPNEEITILNIDGRIIFNERLTSSNLSIPVSNWNKGLYIAKIKNEIGEVVVEKFIVQ